ncbi:unnamed protein product [Vitrella brassicaformis CCMP3155]|uniref:Methyltransferase type 12 domain-containing protein n=2 Tax=Vitrella brassicaformis TaxID=1169539 RepID=A0A0G4H644_VITBC|nr:unnamed protein product [Vitrella brassicaformis CCMP3155]|eukprot:CEM39171.1 unnamed protein product [Vitrella brassicaformis CCMP3155]
MAILSLSTHALNDGDGSRAADLSPPAVLLQKHLDEANALYRSNRKDEAEKAYRSIVSLLEGVDESNGEIKDASALAELRVSVLCNMGSLMVDKGDLDEARRLFEAAVAFQPDHADALFNLGTVLHDTHHYWEAIDRYEQAIAAEAAMSEMPSLSWTSVASAANMGSAYETLESLPEAVETYQIAMEILDGLMGDLTDQTEIDARSARRGDGAAFLTNEEISQMHTRLAEGLLRIQAGTYTYWEEAGKEGTRKYKYECSPGSCVELAAEHFRRALRFDKSNSIADYSLRSMQKDSTLTEASPDYVKSLFDHYADTFDKSLQKLHYQAPLMIRMAVDRLQESLLVAYPLRNVLDVGCGTGLSGQVFRNVTTFLYGFDLSPEMIRLAEEKGVYNATHVGDLQSGFGALAGHGLHGKVDLITAADVLVYVGDLREFFQRSSEVIRKDGRGFLAFSVEELTSELTSDEEDKGYQVQTTGRFAHTREYVVREGGRWGFSAMYGERIYPRFEYGEPVKGLLFVLRYDGQGDSGFRKKDMRSRDEL